MVAGVVQDPEALASVVVRRRPDVCVLPTALSGGVDATLIRSLAAAGREPTPVLVLDDDCAAPAVIGFRVRRRHLPT